MDDPVNRSGASFQSRRTEKLCRSSLAFRHKKNSTQDKSWAQILPPGTPENGFVLAFPGLLAAIEAAADLLDPERREKAKVEAEWQAYSQRPKTTLEQVLNYTSTADVNGAPDWLHWISAANGQNKCVLERTVKVFGTTKQQIDIRRLSGVGFRISKDWVGDEHIRITRADAAVLERLQKAWGLAFAECPSVEKAPF